MEPGGILDRLRQGHADGRRGDGRGEPGVVEDVQDGPVAVAEKQADAARRQAVKKGKAPRKRRAPAPGAAGAKKRTAKCAVAHA